MPSSPRTLWFLAALCLVVGMTAYTRLPAPWRMGVTNDEMLHLESYRNRYRTDDQYPLFIQKVEDYRLLEGERLEQFKEIYASSRLFQRALFVLIDLHPPIFPVMAEVFEVVTHSSLIAIRMISVVASMLAVLFMYKLGRELRGPTLGMWMAGLQSIGFLAITYAGIARPYTLAQCATFLAFWVFVREQDGRHRSPWRFWLAALFAQGTNWLVWSFIGPLVIIELLRRYLAGSGIATLFRQTWWYALISMMLLPLMAVQLMNPGASANTGGRSLYVLWYHFYLASPFANIDSMMGLPVLAVGSPAGVLMLLAVLAGIACVLADPDFLRGGVASGLTFPTVRAALIITLVTSALCAIFGASGTRIALIYIMVPMIFAGLGLHWACRTRRVSQVVLTIVLAVFAVLRIGWPEDPYIRAFWSQTDYEAVARHIEAELGPEDEWCAFPRQLADCLYRYADLPEPIVTITREDLSEVLATVPRDDHAVFFFVRPEMGRGAFRLRREQSRREFVNGFEVVKVPKKGSR